MILQSFSLNPLTWESEPDSLTRTRESLEATKCTFLKVYVDFICTVLRFLGLTRTRIREMNVLLWWGVNLGKSFWLVKHPESHMELGKWGSPVCRCLSLLFLLFILQMHSSVGHFIFHLWLGAASRKVCDTGFGATLFRTWFPKPIICSLFDPGYSTGGSLNLTHLS